MIIRIVFSYVFVALPCAAYAMADRTPPVYGRPTLYGEYEISGDDVRRARAMYGDVPIHVQPIRTSLATKQPAAKHPVKAKSVAPKKKAKKKVVPQKKAAAPAAADIIIVPAKVAEVPAAVPPQVETAPEPMPEVVVAPKPVPRADEKAENIAGALSYKLNADSYCTQRATPHSGNLPDGYILMQGRPDLMSCRDEK